MWRRGLVAALVLMSGCAATDEPYIPPNPSTTSETDVVVPPGPTNPEIFSAIERAENAIDGSAVAFETRVQSYVISTIADGVLYEVTIVSSGIIINEIREIDEDAEEFLKTQVVTLADAVDAAAVAHPGRVDSAEIEVVNNEPVYDVTIEIEDALLTVTIDGYSAEIVQR